MNTRTLQNTLLFLLIGCSASVFGAGQGTAASLADKYDHDFFSLLCATPDTDPSIVDDRYTTVIRLFHPDKKKPQLKKEQQEHESAVDNLCRELEKQDTEEQKTKILETHNRNMKKLFQNSSELNGAFNNLHNDLCNKLDKQHDKEQKKVALKAFNRNMKKLFRKLTKETNEKEEQESKEKLRLELKKRYGDGCEVTKEMVNVLEDGDIFKTFLRAMKNETRRKLYAAKMYTELERVVDSGNYASTVQNLFIKKLKGEVVDSTTTNQDFYSKIKTRLTAEKLKEKYTEMVPASLIDPPTAESRKAVALEEKEWWKYCLEQNYFEKNYRISELGLKLLSAALENSTEVKLTKQQHKTARRRAYKEYYEKHKGDPGTTLPSPEELSDEALEESCSSLNDLKSMVEAADNKLKIENQNAMLVGANKKNDASANESIIEGFLNSKALECHQNELADLDECDRAKQELELFTNYLQLHNEDKVAGRKNRAQNEVDLTAQKNAYRLLGGAALAGIAALTLGFKKLLDRRRDKKIAAIELDIKQMRDVKDELNKRTEQEVRAIYRKRYDDIHATDELYKALLYAGGLFGAVIAGYHVFRP